MDQYYEYSSPRSFIYRAIVLLFISAIVLALIIVSSFSTTGLYNSGFANFRPPLLASIPIICISYLKFYLGNGLLALPLTLFVWSYRFFFNKPLTYAKIRVLALLCSTIFSSVFLQACSLQSGGVIGVYLISCLHSWNDLIIWFALGLALASFIVAAGITFRETVTVLNSFAYITSFMFSWIIYASSWMSQGIVKLLRAILLSGRSQPQIANNVSSALASLKQSEHEVIHPLSRTVEQEYITNTDNEFFAPLSESIDIPMEANEHFTNTSKKAGLAAKLGSALFGGSSKPSDLEVESDHFLSEKRSAPVPAAPKKRALSLSTYSIPLSLLQEPTKPKYSTSTSIKQTALKLERIIKEFGIEARTVGYKTGPVVTLFEIAIPPGVKTSKIINLEVDIALRMKAFSVRIAVVLGKDVIGIEIPNETRQTVYLRTLLENPEFTNSSASLPLSLGLDIGGKPIVADLATMPHLLVAGTTGSGKSVAVNAMILSLLYKYSPEQCKMIMIDPKMLELSIYQDIPHLLTPVVTNPKKAIHALKWAVKQMEHRYALMSYLGVRNITGYNQKLKDTEYIEQVQSDLLHKEGYETQFDFMPYLIVIIDEMADLMLVAGKEIEAAVQRLAQMARAAGIHVIMATQRPSVDVITGTIKANFPTRVSFQVSSRIDSTTILGDKGAEQLLGKGDMLYMMGVGRLLRVHGPFVSDTEVEKVVEAVKRYGSPNYIQDITSNQDNLDGESNSDQDELYEEVINLIREEQKVSTSYIQRRFQIGYNRAARIIEQLEANGIVSKPSATGKREIYL